MKKIIVVLLLLVLVLPNAQKVFAQSEGVITYEITVNNHRNIPADREGMKAMVPEFTTYKQQLFFNANESLYKPLIEEESEEPQPGQRRFRQPRSVNYTEVATTTFITQADMMGKKYLITDTLKPAPWKFGSEIKIIQGYQCMQAYYTTQGDRPQTITAWFTSQLRGNLGPDRYNTLPGAVLAVDINNAERVFVAKKIELRALNKNELSAPTDGEKITQAEFRKKGEEMRQRFNNGGGMRRRGN